MFFTDASCEGRRDERHVLSVDVQVKNFENRLRFDKVTHMS